MSPLDQAAVTFSPAGVQQLSVVSISIIIPALNEARMIGKCLDSLTQLDFPRDHFEVILVDNGSTDDTIKIAESFADRIHLRILQKRDVRISGLRNFGAREAQGEVVAFLDADCLAPSNWLNQILEFALTDNSGVLGAYYLLPGDSTWVGRTWHRYQEAPKSGDVSHVPAGDLIMRREDFLKLNGFDETIQTNEDYELCERVRAGGMPVRAYPEIGVIHLGTAQSLRVFFRKQAWHGTHVVKVFLRDVFRSHNLKAVFFAAYTLLCAIVVIAGMIWTLAGHGPWLLPLTGVAALLLPPLVLSLRQIAASGRWADFLPLTALYLTYGLARAKSLLAVKNFF